jgi:hypothetical protein
MKSTLALLRVSVVKSSLPRGKRQQRNIACPLNCRREPALVRRTNTGQAPWNDLAAFGHKLPKQANVLVVNVVNFLHAELADLLATEKFPSTAFAAARPTVRSRAIRPSALGPLRWCGYFLIFVSHVSPSSSALHSAQIFFFSKS